LGETKVRVLESRELRTLNAQFRSKLGVRRSLLCRTLTFVLSQMERNNPCEDIASPQLSVELRSP